MIQIISKEERNEGCHFEEEEKKKKIK